MTQREFEALVARLEALAAKSPGRYRQRVAALAVLGYAYVFGIVAATLALLGGVVALFAMGSGRAALLKIALALAGLVYLVARGLWVRLAPPEGEPLAREQVPALFDAIDRARRRVRGPRVHEVLLVDDFNAAVSQVPRLGVLGWQKNHLLLGLPLLQALPADEFEAVLAHEFGHLSGAHGRLGGWIYRARAGWSRLVAEMEEDEHWGAFLFRPFFRWYAPFFAAYSFVQARAQELEADRGGAGLAGARTMADALCRLEITGDFLEERYWPGVVGRADRSAEPDVTPYAAIGRAVREDLRREDAQAALSQALRAQTTVADTHPCLSDRLAALGMEPRVPRRGEAPPAAEVLLGDELPELARILDARWADGVRESWSERFQYVERSTSRLTALDAREHREPLERDEAWEQARLREEFEGPERALVLYRALLEREPEHTGARFALGRLLVAQDDEEGLPHLDAAMKANENAILPGCELAFGFLRRHGRTTEAERYRERAAAQQSKRDRAEAERASVKLDDRYLPHGLGDDDARELRAALRRRPQITGAWLVRRDVELYPERPLFVLGVEQHRSWLQQKPKDLALQQVLADQIPLPGEFFVLVLNHRPRGQRRIFTQVEGSRVLP